MRIVLTGGPCAGKTSALEHLREYLDRPVIVVPEVATLMFGGGVTPPFECLDDAEKIFAVEEAMMRTQAFLEERFWSAAQTHEDPVLIIDRGLLDYKAYVDAEMWRRLTNHLGMTELSMASRYHAVIHMSTAPEVNYTLDNNATRVEDYATSLQLCDAVKAAWAIHPHRFEVTNEHGNFEDKLEETLRTVVRAIDTAPTLF